MFKIVCVLQANLEMLVGITAAAVDANFKRQPDGLTINPQKKPKT